jgi:hypothetical protein
MRYARQMTRSDQLVLHIFGSQVVSKKIDFEERPRSAERICA